MKGVVSILARDDPESDRSVQLPPVRYSIRIYVGKSVLVCACARRNDASTKTCYANARDDLMTYVTRARVLFCMNFVERGTSTSRPFVYRTSTCVRTTRRRSTRNCELIKSSKSFPEGELCKSQHPAPQFLYSYIYGSSRLDLEKDSAKVLSKCVKKARGTCRTEWWGYGSPPWRDWSPRASTHSAARAARVHDGARQGAAPRGLRTRAPFCLLRCPGGDRPALGFAAYFMPLSPCISRTRQGGPGFRLLGRSCACPN